MKLQDLQSKETVEFIETLNSLKELITAAFTQRTPPAQRRKIPHRKTGRRVASYQRETIKRLPHEWGHSLY